MLRAHAQHQWTLGAHQPPPPTDRYEQPLPPKGCRGRMRNISGRWGRIRPPPPTDRYEHPLPPYIKGLLIEYNPSFLENLSGHHPLSKVKKTSVNFCKFSNKKLSSFQYDEHCDILVKIDFL